MIEMVNWSNGMGFDWLVSLLIASTIMISMAWCLVAMMKTRSAANRFCIWQAAFVGLMLVPLAIEFLPKIPLGLSGYSASLESKSAKMTSNDFDSMSPTQTMHPAIETDHNKSPLGDLFRLDHPKTARSSIDSIDADSTMSDNGFDNERQASTVTQTRVSTSSTMSGLLKQWRLVCVSVWLIGIVLILTRIVSSFVWGFQISKRSTSVESGSRLGAELLAVTANTSCKATVPLRLSNEIEVPVTMGIFNPKILLPIDARHWSRDRVRMVLRHELAHIRRRDLLWQSVASFAKACCWIQPLVWIADREMKLERERACDDQVIQQGERPSEYAAVLLGLAAELSGRPVNLFGGLSMAQKPIEKRLTTVLQPLTRRGTSTLAFRVASVVSFATAVVLLSTLRPFGALPVVATESETAVSTSAVSFKNGQEETQSKKVALPDQVVGKVVDADGEPIANARVEFAVLSFRDAEKFTLGTERIELPKTTTNAQGEYVLNTTGVKVNPKMFNVWGYIFADGYPVYHYAQQIRSLKSEVKLRTATMNPGRKITGRIVAPQGEHAIPTNVVLRIHGDASHAKGFMGWNSSTIKCDDNGQFETYVPKIGRVELKVTAENYAGVKVAVDPQTQDLGDIRLVKGTILFGTVRDQLGNPISGLVVTVNGQTYNNVNTMHKNGMFGPIRFSTKTDAKGRYRLAPHSGDIRISIDRTSQLRDQDRFIYSDNEMPIIRPQLINLADKGVQLEVNLEEEPTSKASGIVRFDDGTPAANIYMHAIVMCGGSGVNVDECFTNEKGEYELRFPKHVKSGASISASGVRQADGIYAYPNPEISNPATDKLALNKRSQSVQFKSVDNDFGGVDWVMKPREPKTEKTFTTSPGSRESQTVLKEIGARFYRDQRTGSLNIGALTDDLVKLESDYRGELAAIIALDRIFIWTADSDGSAESMKQSTRHKSLKIIGDHYLKHADVDLCLNRVVNQLHDPSGIELLKKFQQQSPHRRVRATAYYVHAEHLSKQLGYYQLFESRGWKPGYTLPKDATETQLKRAADETEKLIRTIKMLEPEKLKVEIKSIAKIINQEFNDVRESQQIASIRSFDFRRYEPKDGKTYASRIKPIFFELDRLQSGMVVPEIEGSGVMGKAFKLSELRGKAVVVFFSSNWHHPRQHAFYARFRELKEKYKDQPFEIVSVLVDNDIKHAKEPVDAGSITWRTFWDKDSQVVTDWHIDGLPSDLILIDHNGVIKRRLVGKDDPQLEEAIEKLVNEAKR